MFENKNQTTYIQSDNFQRMLLLKGLYDADAMDCVGDGEIAETILFHFPNFAKKFVPGKGQGIAISVPGAEDMRLLPQGYEFYIPAARIFGMGADYYSWDLSKMF